MAVAWRPLDLTRDEAACIENIRVWEARRATLTDDWLCVFLTGEIRRERAKLAGLLRARLAAKRGGVLGHQVVS